MSDKLSPEHLEKDIEADRTALAETLGALSDHVSVDRWINEASQTLQTSGGDLVETVRRTARDNPGALVAAGAGVALLAYGVTRVAASQDDSPAHSIPATGPAQRIAEDGYVASRGNLRVATGGPAVAAQPGVDPLSPEFDARLRDADAALRASEPRLAEERADAWAADPWGATGDDLADTLGGNAQDQGMRETSGDTARDRLETRATEAREQIEARAATLRARIGDGLDTLNEEARNRVLQARAQAYEAQRAVEAAAEKSKTAFQQHPLAFGLGAVALGAVAAVLLPRSEAETARRAQQRDALMSRAKAIYAEEKRKLVAAARAAATETKHQVREAIDAAGEDAANAKEQASDAAEKITKAARSAYAKDGMDAKAKTASDTDAPTPSSAPKADKAPNVPNGRA